MVRSALAPEAIQLPEETILYGFVVVFWMPCTDPCARDGAHLVAHLAGDPDAFASAHPPVHVGLDSCGLWDGVAHVAKLARFACRGADPPS